MSDMTKRGDTERGVDRTVALLDQWERKAPGKDLWPGIERRMRKGRGEWRAALVLLRPRWQLALLAVLLAVNLLFGWVMKDRLFASTRVMTTSGLDDFKKEYKLGAEEYEWEM